MRKATAEQAHLELSKALDEVHILAQFNIASKYPKAKFTKSYSEAKFTNSYSKAKFK